ncbi:MAG TPA: NAD(P)/FAD-dependent oxidoreductase [Chloroflexia bacterium]|nr:NAD(P)/FAD-dependent oxidoreductase [Chloroflexia bacterium]
MSKPADIGPRDVGHEPPAPPTRVPEGTADPRPPDVGRRIQPVDCLIVGGGPAGLSAAVYLGRMRRSTIVVDDRSGRSLWSQVNRNYLGFPDGIEAQELRKLGREQAARYGTVFCNGCVSHISKRDELFRIQVGGPGPLDDEEGGTERNRKADVAHGARLGEQQVQGRRAFYARTVLLATGVHDEFPDFAGRDECVGRSLFWCIICDGYEAIDKRVVVIGHDEEAVTTALQLRQFSNTISLVAGQDGFAVPDDRLQDLAAAGIEAFPYAVQEYPNGDGCLTAVHLADLPGTRLPLDLIFTVSPHHPNTGLARELGVSLSPKGYILADAEQKTNVAGVYAAGDATRLHNHQVSSAVHEGGMAAAAVNYYLYGGVQKPQDSD